MARRQAKRRKQREARQWRMPAIPVARITRLTVAVATVVLSYHFSSILLDKPIRAITVEGPFQRVSALQIEEAIADELSHGFLSADLHAIRERVAALPWIDQATVARRWPATLEIAVTEQVPAACWGEAGLLNTRGELFVTNARHIPAELPRLSGPEDRSADVARRYLTIREQLIPMGLDVRRVHLDARGAWELTLQNGVDIRLGRRDVDQRTDLFIDVVANIVASREADIDFVDMRYSNGFSIGWREDASPATDVERDTAARSLVAGRQE
ncbi:MAG: cell division protein FtsQ/DivIB [Gammaproteobacteria bacterium]|nr:cell division protein FtsQ/DivIB [Gammaproteobacteria bacterium]MDH4253796.1 cell division protein FtsQ/DivIB [Gammaproteobacteria bacterium]MDH5308631.1 cell division protein FtsQ/DivIB [Gammaproteobacteria bacterium]